jgi:hypothetical protein
MPRTLKTFVAASGFFELAVAAPTMKAALEAWGAGPDLFRRGYARETNDPAIVKATTAKPGIVLKRAVGSQRAFKEQPDLPDVSTWEKPAQPPAQAPKTPAKPKPVKAVPMKAGPTRPSAAAQSAARLDAKAQKKREREAARAEAADRKALELRQKAIAKARNALRAAREAHDERVLALEKERVAWERRQREENERWRAQERELTAALKDAE